jgi:hypothetical protein
MMWAQSWATVREAVGHDPTAEEVAEWWGQAVRSVYREQAAFRACFPTLDTPAPIYEDPELRAKLRRSLRPLLDRDPSHRTNDAPDPDTAILNIGMQPAPPGLTG